MNLDVQNLKRCENLTVKFLQQSHHFKAVRPHELKTVVLLYP
jgi:hypothetical protein